MPTRTDPDTPRASWWETLGAWTGVWTPPRDVEVPPVPRRKAAVLAAVLGLVVVAIVVLVAPAIDSAKKDRTARARQAASERQAAAHARQRIEQRPRTGRG